MRINSGLAQMPAGYLFATIAEKVRGWQAANPGQKLLRLGIGDVTRPLGPHIAGTFAQAAQAMATPEGFHGYGPEGGYPFLVDAIIENDYAARGITLEPGEVFISDGAKSDTAALQELFDPDAVIAVADPVYPVYVDANAMAGRLGTWQDGRWGKLVYLPCTMENGCVPAPPQQHADVLYLCYPNNPTGTVLTHAQLKTFVDWAREHDALIVYDAAYKCFITDDSLPRSIYEVEGAKEVAIECCSFSKTAGFTGVRCAWTVVPKALRGLDDQGQPHSLNAMWHRRTASKFNGVSYPVQRAAQAVYSPQGQREVLEARDYYLRNARIIREGLQAAGIAAFGGEHAPYIWMKTPGDMDSWTFFDRLLNEAQVVGTPGSGFGPSGEGYFRLTAFGSHVDTVEATQRIRSLLR